MAKIWKIGNSPPSGAPEFAYSSHKGVIPYIQNFLTSPHPYRSGAMCPFMPRALAERNIYFTYFETEKTDQELQQLIKFCSDFYKNNRNNSFGAVIILFNEEFDLNRLLRAHIKAKITCIDNELMIGALYKESQASSLHSQDYFPLRTPTPVLVIRDLTTQDLQFLHPNHYGIISKIKFLNKYIQKFSKPSAKGKTKEKQMKQLFYADDTQQLS